MVEKRGGFQKKIDFDKIIELSSPYRRNMDCCPCSFRFLDLISDNDFTSFLKKYGDTGMFEHNIIDFFQKKYEIFSDNYHFRMAEADFSNKTKREVINIIVNLFKTIKKGYGVIGGIVRQDDTSHCIILFRDLNGYSYVIDAQSNEMYQSRPSKDSKSFGDFFYGNRVKKLFYLTAHNIKDGRILLIDEERQSMIFEDAIKGPPKIEEEDDDDDEDDIFEDALEGPSGGYRRKRKKRTKKRTKKRKK